MPFTSSALFLCCMKNRQPEQGARLVVLQVFFMKSWSFRKIIMKNHGSAVSRNFRQPVPSQPTKTPPSQHFDSIFTLANLNKSEEAKKYERKIGKICLPRIRKKANEWKMFGNGFFISLFVMVYFNDLWLSFSTDFFPCVRNENCADKYKSTVI